MPCFNCKKVVSSTELLACRECQNQFHYHCLQITKAQFKELSDKDKRSWQCNGCRNVSRRKRNDDTPIGKSQIQTKSPAEQQQEDSPVSNDKEENDQQTDISCQLITFKQEMKEMIAIQGREFRQTLKEIQQSNANIETAIAFITDQNEEYRKKIEELEVQTKKDRERITFLENKVEDLQRGSRKTSIEIKNVPKSSNETQEDLLNMMTCLSKNLDCKIVDSDIRDIYRVNGKSQLKNSPIIVETCSTITRTNILRMCKAYNTKRKEKLCAKHLGFTKNEDTPIFVSEQLTAKGARLHFLARDLAKSKSYKFCWTAFGRVYVRRNETSPKIRIDNEAQVHSLLQEK